MSLNLNAIRSQLEAGQDLDYDQALSLLIAHDRAELELSELRAIRVRAREAVDWGPVSNAQMTARYILEGNGS